MLPSTRNVQNTIIQKKTVHRKDLFQIKSIDRGPCKIPLSVHVPRKHPTLSGVRNGRRGLGKGRKLAGRGGPGVLCRLLGVLRDVCTINPSATASQSCKCLDLLGLHVCVDSRHHHHLLSFSALSVVGAQHTSPQDPEVHTGPARP